MVRSHALAPFVPLKHAPVRSAEMKRVLSREAEVKLLPVRSEEVKLVLTNLLLLRSADTSWAYPKDADVRSASG